MIENTLILLLGIFIGFLIGLGYLCDLMDWIKIKYYEILEWFNGPRFF